MNKINKKCLVVLSGGQDSVTCLGLALAHYAHVEAITFIYGQKHVIETQCAAALCIRHNVPHKVVNLSCLADVVTSALTGPGEVGQPHAYKPGLPSSFVPGRNALFLTLAHAHAQEIKADVIATGVCQTDYSGYPDCRAAFVAQLNLALNTGYECYIRILTPLMWLTKAESFVLAEETGFLGTVLEDSHTCYVGNHTDRHEWGFGCGKCPACELRKQGYDAFLKLDQNEPELNAKIQHTIATFRMGE